MRESAEDAMSQNSTESVQSLWQRDRTTSHHGRVQSRDQAHSPWYWNPGRWRLVGSRGSGRRLIAAAQRHGVCRQPAGDLGEFGSEVIAQDRDALLSLFLDHDPDRDCLYTLHIHSPLQPIPHMPLLESATGQGLDR